MQVYEFALCPASDGVQSLTEQLGYIALPDDKDALEFAKPIAEDLAQANGAFHGAVVKITANNRLVGNVPVDKG